MDFKDYQHSLLIEEFSQNSEFVVFGGGGVVLSLFSDCVFWNRLSQKGTGEHSDICKVFQEWWCGHLDLLSPGSLWSLSVRFVSVIFSSDASEEDCPVLFFMLPRQGPCVQATHVYQWTAC